MRGVNALELTDPDSGEVVFSTAATEMNIPDGVNNLHAKVDITYYCNVNSMPVFNNGKPSPPSVKQ